MPSIATSVRWDRYLARKDLDEKGGSIDTSLRVGMARRIPFEGVMATWKRVPWTRLRAIHVRGFWSQGKQEVLPGKLFGETPPPPGQSRKWESWELP